MSIDDERDLDLERRLRRIAEEPQPPVPLSVYRRSEAVTHERETTMVSRGTAAGYSRRGLSGFARVVGIAAALILAFGMVGVFMTFRQTRSGNEPSASGTASATPTDGGWHAIEFQKLATSPFPSAPEWVSAATVGGRTMVVGTVTTATETKTAAAISSDETTWQPVAPDNNPFASAQQLRVAPCRGGFLVVAVAGSTLGFYSRDAVSWQESSIGSPWPLPADQNQIGTTPEGAIVLTGSGLYFASDCVAWKHVALPAVDGVDVVPAAASALGGRFVVVATVPGKSDAVTYTSTDGNSWTPSAPAAPVLHEIWAARGGLLGSEAANTGVGFYTTRDGQTWQHLTSVGLLGYGGLASDGTRIVLWKEQQSMLTTTDGLTWSTLPIRGTAPVVGPGDGTIEQLVVLSDALLVFKGGEAYLGREPGAAKPATPPPASATPGSTETPGPSSSAPAQLPADVVTDGADPTAKWTAIDFAQAKGASVHVGSTAVRWKGGWVEWDLYGALSNMAWLSQDGRTWHAVAAPGYVYPTATGLGARDTAAHKAWVSADGAKWSQIAYSEPAGGASIEPEYVPTAIGLVLIERDTTQDRLSRIYFTADGGAWHDITPSSPIYHARAAWTGQGIVLVGMRQDDQGNRDKVEFQYTQDGANWLPTGFPAMVAATDCQVYSGSAGVLAACARTTGTSTTTVWMTSQAGDTWSVVNGFGPLSTSNGSANPDGALYSNGLRILARSTDGRLWSSFDGATWTQLAAMAVPIKQSDTGDPLYVAPRVVYYTAADGSTYVGKSR